MHEMSSTTADATGAAAARGAPAPPGRSRLRLGIGGRLALWLAALAAVLLIGQFLTTRTTGLAVTAVRDMQTEHEPRAQRASALVEALVAYDRTVIDYLQEGRASEAGTITAAADALEEAVQAYFQGPG